MSSPSNTSPEQAQQAEAPRPAQQQPQAEAQQSASLLDRIVSESQIEQRDAIIIRRAEFDQKQRLARMFAISGCFQDIDKDEHGSWLSSETSIARALIKIELGEAMGFSPAESMTGVDIIKGRIAVGASLRAARMQRAGYSWPQMILTNKGCWMPLCFQGVPMLAPKTNEDGVPITDANGSPIMVQVKVSFTEDDAKLLGLLDKNQSMYKKDPSSMYFARTVTRAQRRYGPGVLGVDALDTHEAQDIADSDSRPASIETDRLTVQQRIDKAEASYEARVQSGKLKSEQPAKPKEEAGVKPAPDAEQQSIEPNEEAPKDRPIINLSGNDLPDAFEGTDGDRVRLANGTVCQIIDGGWKAIETPAEGRRPVTLPKRK